MSVLAGGRGRRGKSGKRAESTSNDRFAIELTGLFDRGSVTGFNRLAALDFSG